MVEVSRLVAPEFWSKSKPMMLSANLEYSVNISRISPVILSSHAAALVRPILPSISILHHAFGKAQVVVFDKTGTITFGTPAVEQIIPLESSSRDNSINTDDILRKAASVEQLSSHPAVQALLQKAEERKLGKLPIPSNFHEVSGAGVEGDIDGEHIVVGSHSLFENSENEYNRHDNLLDKRYMKCALVL